MSGKQLIVAALGLPVGTWLIFYLETQDTSTIAICMLSSLAVSHLLVEVGAYFVQRKKQAGGSKADKKPR